MIGPGELVELAERRCQEAADGDDAARADAAREREFAGVYADHDRLLAECGALDSGDLVLRAFRLLHEKPHVRRRIADRFRYVLVDDLQDANFAGRDPTRPPVRGTRRGDRRR